MFPHSFENPDQVMLVVKIIGIMTITFLVTFAATPLLTHFLYKYRFGKSIRNTGYTPVYSRLHAKKEGTPVGGGIIIWASVLITTTFFWLLNQIFPSPLTAHLNFLNRAQTLLPLGALFGSAMVGLVDDYLNVRKIGPSGGGLRMSQRLILYVVVAAFGAYWFYYKLNWSVIHVPYLGDFEIGLWYLPLFILVIVATAFSVNEADGLDGLAGGILMFCYGAYSGIAFSLGRIDLATFCAAISGALLAFLWFNVYPARFFMGDTGAMSMGTTLGIIALLTNSVFILPIIAFPLVIESASVIIQVTSKKLLGRKVFLSAPIHHHFEAKGWPETKVTMRFWIIAAVSASAGLVLALISL